MNTANDKKDRNLTRRAERLGLACYLDEFGQLCLAEYRQPLKNTRKKVHINGLPVRTLARGFRNVKSAIQAKERGQ